MPESEILHFALSGIPGGRGNVNEMYNHCVAHQQAIRWPQPDEKELKRTLRNAIHRALKDNPPNIIAHQAKWPKKGKEYTLAHH